MGRKRGEAGVEEVEEEVHGLGGKTAERNAEENAVCGGGGELSGKMVLKER